MKWALVTGLFACLFLTSCKPGLAYRMPTEGMQPTIGTDDLCVANPLAYSFAEVKRFDLVVFRPNKEQRDQFRDDSMLYLMRVVGLPNEKLEIKDNVVYINDKVLEERFPNSWTDWTARRILVRSTSLRMSTSFWVTIVRIVQTAGFGRSRRFT